MLVNSLTQVSSSLALLGTVVPWDFHYLKCSYLLVWRIIQGQANNYLENCRYLFPNIRIGHTQGLLSWTTKTMVLGRKIPKMKDKKKGWVISDISWKYSAAFRNLYLGISSARYHNSLFNNLWLNFLRYSSITLNFCKLSVSTSSLLSGDWVLSKMANSVFFFLFLFNSSVNLHKSKLCFIALWKVLKPLYWC